MKAQSGTVSFFRFVCHSSQNPFLSLLWERARQNPEPFLRKQFVALSIVLVALLLTLFVLELLKVNPLLRGGWLLDAIMLAHAIAASYYSPNKLMPLHQFWREINRHDLLLTGTPALWLVLAHHFCRVAFQAHFTVLCLPFYAAAFAMGAPIDAILLVLVLSLFLHPEVRIAIVLMGWLFWLLFSFAIRLLMGLPFSISPFWENVPFLLKHPIGIYAWQLPAWTIFFALLVSAIARSVLNKAWSLEQRFIPSQISVRRWLQFSIWSFWILLLGLGWAYLPIGYITKFAITLCLLRLAISMAMIEMGDLAKENPQRAWKPMTAFWSALALDGIALAFCAFVGITEGQGNDLVKALTIGAALSLIHAVSFAFGLDFWLRWQHGNLPTGVTATLFTIWLFSPSSLLISSLAPKFSWLGALAGIQGWLVPLGMIETLKLPLRSLAHFQFTFPSWWQMALMQLAWSFLLFAIGRKFAPIRQEIKPLTLTAEHPLFGWLVRLEDRMMERLDNALVNVQIRWQRHHSVGYLYASLIIVFLGFVVIAVVALLPPLRVWLPDVLLVLPLILCFLAWEIAETMLVTIEVKHALWKWGHMRLMEQIILTPLTAKQIWFGLWFPRFWMMLKIIALPLVAAWLIALLQFCIAQSDFLKLASLATILVGTLSLFVGSIAVAVWIVAMGTIGKEPGFTLFWVFWFTPMMAFMQGLFRFSLVILWAFTLAALSILLISSLILLLWSLWHLRRIDELKTPRGYEEWLQLTDDLARKQSRME